jgi:hypothetical protein
MKTWLLPLALMIVLSPLTYTQEEEYSDSEPASEEIPVPEATQARLSSLTAIADEIGLAAVNETLFYSASNLYMYINGAADAFLQYDFEALIHQEFKGGEDEVTVDIYDMGTPLNAFGIYSAERSPQNSYLEIGAQGYRDQFILNFLQDRYYVKLSAFADEQITPELLQKTAQALSRRIEGEKTLPQPLALFPQEKRVPYSEKYVTKSPLGYDFLAPAWTAQYRFGEEESTLVLSAAGTPEEAAARVEKMKAFIGKSGTVEDRQVLGLNAYAGESRYLETHLAFALGNYAVFLLNPPEKSTEFVQELQALVLKK